MKKFPHTRRPRQSSTRIRNRLTKGLAELSRVELVRPLAEIEPAYLFKHALVQDTALSTLLRGEYKRLNMLVAHALEEVNADRLDEYAAQLAQHFGAAEDDVKTLAYATRAGDRAMRVYANREAIAFYSQALEAAARANATTAEWIHLYTRRGRAYELNAQYDAALANYDELEKLGQLRRERALELTALMARLPIFATPTARYDSAKAELLANQALTLAREIGDQQAEAKTLWLRMLTMVRSLRPQNGIADGEAAVALARKLNLRELLAYGLHDLASSYAGIVQFERARELSLEARQLWRELDNKPMLADNLSSMANGLIFIGELDQVIALSREAFQISQAIGNLWGEAYSLAMVGQAYEEHGEYTLAFSAMENCIRYAEQAGFFVPQVQTRAMLAQAYLNIGAQGQAHRVARQALNSKLTQGAMVHPIEIPLRARLYVIMNELEKAEAELAAARSRFRRDDMSSDFTQLLLDFAQVKLSTARGEFGKVHRLLKDLIQELRARNVKLYLPEVMYDLGQALVQLGDPSAAYRTWIEADDAAQEIGSRRMRWQILASLYAMERECGNPERAETFRSAARTNLDYMIAHMPPEFHESFLNLPNVRQVINSTV